MKKACLSCGEKFKPSRPNVLTCSKVCAKDRQLRQIREWRERTARFNRDMCRRYKVMCGCAECGYREHGAALQFDHLDPSKKSFTISARLTSPRDVLKAEIRKCRVMCANCHAIHSTEQRDG